MWENHQLLLNNVNQNINGCTKTEKKLNFFPSCRELLRHYKNLETISINRPVYVCYIISNQVTIFNVSTHWSSIMYKIPCKVDSFVTPATIKISYKKNSKVKWIHRQVSLLTKKKWRWMLKHVFCITNTINDSLSV